MAHACLLEIFLCRYWARYPRDDLRWWWRKMFSSSFFVCEMIVKMYQIVIKTKPDEWQDSEWPSSWNLYPTNDWCPCLHVCTWMCMCVLDKKGACLNEKISVHIVQHNFWETIEIDEREKQLKQKFSNNTCVCTHRNQHHRHTHPILMVLLAVAALRFTIESSWSWRVLNNNMNTLFFSI